MKTSSPRKDGEFLSTLERGLSVLRAFTRERPAMTLSEVAAATHLSPAVARRCLHTLVELGYVGRDGKRFLLTPEVMGFASAFLESMNLEQAVRPHLQTVRDQTGDSSSMAVLSDDEILYLVHVSTNRMVRLGAGIGTRFPAYATSLGRVLLSALSDADLKRYLDTCELKPLTDRTVTSKRELEKIVKGVRKNGYAMIRDELDYGIVSVAVPVCYRGSGVVAAINCSTATSRIDPDEMVDSRLPFLHSAARAIELELQRYPTLIQSIRADSA